MNIPFRWLFIALPLSFACLAAQPTSEGFSEGGRAKIGSIFQGNYWNLGADLVEYAPIDNTSYSFHLVGDHNFSRPGVPPESASMLWLTRCVYPSLSHLCDREYIVNIAPVVPNEVMDSVIVKPNAYAPCTWKNRPILAILTVPDNKRQQTVIAGWDFDLQDEKIVSVPNAEVDCNSYATDKALEDARRKRLSIFIHSKIRELNKLKISGLYKLGKIVKDEVMHGTDDNNPAVKVETHQIQYDGMSVAATVQHGDGYDGFYVYEVKINSPKCSIRDGLLVGSTKKQVQQILGRGTYTECDECMADSQRVLSYSDEDGSTDLRFTFNNEDKVTSIEWQANYP